MEVLGKIIMKLPLQSGTSKAGNQWTKQEYVLETVESYPRKIHFDFFGDRVNQYPLEVGDFIALSFDIESREYQGRWYTSIRGWKAEKRDPNSVATAPAAQNDPFNAPAPANDPFSAPAQPNAKVAEQTQPAAPAQNFTAADKDTGDDLPF